MSAQSPEYLIGTVRTYSAVNEYGFIEVKGEAREFWVSKSLIRPTTRYPALKPWQEVRFRPVEKDGRWRADDVQVISPKGALKPKDSPFHHDSPELDPQRFRGRSDIITKALAQLDGGSILLCGSAGIGKTSVAYQLMQIARAEDCAEPALAAMLNIEDEARHFQSQYRYITHDTQFGTDIGNVKALVHHLTVALQGDTDFIEVRPEEGVQRLARAIRDRLSKAQAGHREPRLLIWIDNVGSDQLNPTALLTELGRKGLDRHKVVFILSGSDLSDKEAPKVHRIPVGAMSCEEVSEVLEAALKPLKVSIEPAAMKRLYELSEGVPSKLHELGNDVFLADTDRRIDREDVAAGFASYLARREKHVIFRDRLHKRDLTDRAILWALVTARGLRADLPFIQKQAHANRKKPFPPDEIERRVKRLVDLDILTAVSDGGKPALRVKDVDFEEYLYDVFSQNRAQKGPNR